MNAPVTDSAGAEHDWLGVRMFFAGIGATATLAEIESVGLRVEHAETVTEDEGGGATASFVWVVAEKPGTPTSTQAGPRR